MQHTQTTVLLINATHPEPPVIEYAAALLRAGELVIFPTETVYGLGADALQLQAVQHVFTAKERILSDPLIVHIADEAALEALVTHIPAQARHLTHAFWPGPLTLVLPANPCVPKLVTAGLDTVAIRMPRHPVALALIRAAGVPVAAPSANRFMHVSPTTAQHALDDLDGRVPLVLDGGPCAVGVESTVLDLCCEIPTILRPGGVSLEALRNVLPDVQPAVHKPSHLHKGQKAPGQLLVHYAPTVPALLFDGPVEAMRKAMLAEVERRQARGEHVGVLIADEDFAAFQGSGARVYTLGSTPEQVAARLFAGLRVLEESEVNVILCRSFEAQGLGLAVRDRLLKASGGNVIYL